MTACHISSDSFVHRGPVVLPLQQFQSLSSAIMDANGGVVDVSEQFQCQFVVVGNNKPILVIQLVISDRAFAQGDLLRPLGSRSDQIHDFLDKIIIRVFIFDDLIGRSISLIQGYGQVGLEQVGSEQCLVSISSGIVKRLSILDTSS